MVYRGRIVCDNFREDSQSCEMSAFGLSKADREIAAQGTDVNQTAVEKKRSGKNVAGRTGNVPGNFSNESDLASNDGNSESLKSGSKGKGPDKQYNERKYQHEDERYEKVSEQATSSKPSYQYGEGRDPQDDDEDAGAGWDRPAGTVPRNGSRTLLEWNLFDWKPPQSDFLRGIGNWSMYREAVLLHLECIGYEPGMKLTPLDEVRLAAVIQRTTTAETRSLVMGMKRGTEMMRLFERTYRQVGEIQQEAVWGNLIALKYTGGCPVEYVTKFKTAVRDYISTGGTLAEKQISIIFKQSTKEKAGRWNSMVSTIARFQS